MIKIGHTQMKLHQSVSLSCDLTVSIVPKHRIYCVTINSISAFFGFAISATTNWEIF